MTWVPWPPAGLTGLVEFNELTTLHFKDERRWPQNYPQIICPPSWRWGAGGVQGIVV